MSKNINSDNSRWKNVIYPWHCFLQFLYWNLKTTAKARLIHVRTNQTLTRKWFHFNANNSFFDQSHGHKVGALCNLKYWNIVVNLRLVPLCNTFSNPYNIAAFLFLELDISVKHSKMELLLKRKCVHLDLENITTASAPQKKLKEGKFFQPIK